MAAAPDRRSCTYARNAVLAASFARFGRRAGRSACQCAVVARYASSPSRVAASRRSSRAIADAARPSRRATSRTPKPCARNSAISSRPANERDRPESGLAERDRCGGGAPPAVRNQRNPTGCDAPACIAASSLDNPAATNAQNRRRRSCRATEQRHGRAPRRPQMEAALSAKRSASGTSSRRRVTCCCGSKSQPNSCKTRNIKRSSVTAWFGSATVANALRSERTDAANSATLVSGKLVYAGVMRIERFSFKSGEHVS